MTDHGSLVLIVLLFCTTLGTSNGATLDGSKPPSEAPDRLRAKRHLGKPLLLSRQEHKATTEDWERLHEEAVAPASHGHRHARELKEQAHAAMASRSSGKTARGKAAKDPGEGCGKDRDGQAATLGPGEVLLDDDVFDDQGAGKYCISQCDADLESKRDPFLAKLKVASMRYGLAAVMASAAKSAAAAARAKVKSMAQQLPGHLLVALQHEADAAALYAEKAEQGKEEAHRRQAEVQEDIKAIEVKYSHGVSVNCIHECIKEFGRLP